MNCIDKKFSNLVNEIKSLSEKELYYHMRRKFDSVDDNTKVSCMEFFNKFNYWGLLDIKNSNYEEIENKAYALHSHIDDYVWVYNHLADYKSKNTLYAILNNWYNYDFITTYKTQERMYDDYFDLDLVKCDNNEVIVDLGAYVGDTVESYINNYGSDCYKKIYCYEITEESFGKLKENLKDYNNIDFRLKGIGDIEGKMALANNVESPSANRIIESDGNIPVTTLDNDINEKITLIKADIEGFEQKALLGSKNHILNDHPKLLISVYHSNDDLWKIPKTIYDMHSDYKFYLRFTGSYIYPTEITLISI